MGVEKTVADEVCRMLADLQQHGGTLGSIYIGWEISNWVVKVSVLGAPGSSRVDDINREVRVETFDVALAVVTAVG